jgi:hypothetical protein
MTNRSLRTFALDYYRQQGASVEPLAQGETYAIARPGKSQMTVAFQNEAPSQDLVSLSPTSPQWRSILEDLTEQVAVSYRYLVAGAIAHPGALLNASMPAGYQVLEARLESAKNHSAIGYTHRVSFDAQALNARQEVLHQHVWDLSTLSRSESLEAALYQADCLLLRPEEHPPESTLLTCLERSVGEIDQASDVRGALIEGELQNQFVEAENRTNQYYDQQMGQVLQREVTLCDKLDAAIKRLSEAKTPDAVARNRQECENVSKQLEQIKARREGDLALIQEARAQKLIQEREKHELTALTELVALCHVRYDVLSYRASVLTPGGEMAQWLLGYTPVTKELTLPPCGSCNQAFKAPVRLADGRFVCESCSSTCPACESRHDLNTPIPAPRCAACKAELCTECTLACVHCQEALCSAHAVVCAVCVAPSCMHCQKACHRCKTSLCQDHAPFDALTGTHYCEAHVPVSKAPSFVITPNPSDPQAKEPPGIESSVLPRCCGCECLLTQDASIACPTCHIGACATCVEASEGFCPACESLSPIDATDALLDAVYQAQPALLKGKRTWEAASVGPYVLAYWRRFGAWGLLAYDASGPEPVWLAEIKGSPWEGVKRAIARVWNRTK